MIPNYTANYTKTFHDKRVGKKIARIRNKEEVKVRNLRLRDMAIVGGEKGRGVKRGMSTLAGGEGGEDWGDDLLAVKVSVCPELRESMHLNGREKRGRMFVTRGSEASRR